MPVAVLCGRRDPLHAGFFVMGGFFADGVNGTPAFAFQTLDALVLQTMGMDIVGSCPVGVVFATARLLEGDMRCPTLHREQ